MSLIPHVSALHPWSSEITVRSTDELQSAKSHLEGKEISVLFWLNMFLSLVFSATCFFPLMSDVFIVVWCIPG